MSCGTDGDGFLQGFDDPESHVGRSFGTDEMQREDGELVSTEPGCQVAVTHCAEQPLRDDSKNLISNSVPINIVDLLKAVQVQKDQSVYGAFSWWGGGGSLDRIIKLPPIREPGQRVLEG